MQEAFFETCDARIDAETSIDSFAGDIMMWQFGCCNYFLRSCRWDEVDATFDSFKMDVMITNIAVWLVVVLAVAGLLPGFGLG